jgi:hypothetical protein
MPVQDEVHEIRDEVRNDIKNRALAHMVEQVNSTPAEREPFPHFIVHEIFPAAVYREMLSLLPDQSFYKTFNRSKSSESAIKRLMRMQRWSGDRARFKLTNASIDRLSGRERSFWLGVRDALGAPEFKAAVFTRLREGLALRFGDGEDVAKLPGYALPELFRETSGYRIEPHPDTDSKVVTMQIALPPDNTQERLGTQFYRRSLSPRHLFTEPRGFEVAKQVPFLPNVAYAFVVMNATDPKSWHGRTTLRGEVGVRNTILNLWFADSARGNRDIVEQYHDAP